MYCDFKFFRLNKIIYQLHDYDLWIWRSKSQSKDGLE